MIKERRTSVRNTEQQPVHGGILAVHFKLHGGDGVSLQSQILHEALRDMSQDVYECCSDLPKDCEGLSLPELTYQSEEVKSLRRNVFQPDETTNEHEVASKLDAQTTKILFAVEQFVDDHNIHTVHVRNILSLPYNVAATLAFYELAKKRPDIQFIAQHHDFIHENRQHIFPRSPFPTIAQRLDEAILPKLPNIHHVVINSAASEYLKQEHGIDATILPDGFNFDTSAQYETGENKFRKIAGIGENDLVVGVMTRFDPRKSIEFAIEFTHALAQHRRDLENMPSGIGPKKRAFTKDSSIVLVLPQHEDINDYRTYYNNFKQYAAILGVKIVEQADKVNSDIHLKDAGADKVGFFDIYKELDVVCYPTTQEGFGNQLLEAVALARHTIPVVFEYPVFQKDIADKLPHYVSLGSTYQANQIIPGLKSLPQSTVEAAVSQSIRYLQNPEIADMDAEENFQMAKSTYDIKVLAKQVVGLARAESPEGLHAKGR